MKNMKSRKKLQSRKNKFNALQLARQGSACAFVACLGVWLPKSYAATLVNVDSTSLTPGPLAAWSNTGTLGGSFTPGLGATNPVVAVVDGVTAVKFENGAGGLGSHMVGPAATLVSSNATRTVEAWVLDNTVQTAGTVISFGRRGTDGFNNGFGLGTHDTWGAVGGFGAWDIGYNNNEVFGRWTYIVQSHDGATSSVYVDGQLANSESRALLTAATDTALNPIPFRLARETNADGTVADASQYNGYVARVRVHDTPMNAAAIQAQFDAEKGDFGLNDSDGDGMPDWWENRYGLNPAVDDSGDDTGDSDGLSNLGEFQTGNFQGTLFVTTDPTNPDSDADGSNDGNEVNVFGSDPTDPDTDDDSLLDGVETDTGLFVSASDTGTSPINGDTDGDGWSDGFEVAQGSDPNGGSEPNVPAAIALDATGLAPGTMLTNWSNTGFIAGDFTVPTNASVPSVVSIDGVNGVMMTTPTHYIGPNQIAALSGSAPRSVDAWVWDDTPQVHHPVIAWGRRAGTAPDGANWAFGMGTHNTWGAVAMWGAPDIGFNDREVYGRWTHIAATYNGAQTYTYVDGELADQQTETVNTTQFQANDGVTPLRFRINRQNNENGGIDAVDTGTPMNIGKITVYTNFLDAATIKARFEAGKPTFNLNDADGDGMPAWYEVRNGLDDNDATGVNGAAGNADTDTLTNIEEYNLGTRADLADTDADGSNDDVEISRVDTGLPAPPTGAVAATDPLNPDTDGDGILDGAETDTGTFVSASNTGTDPLQSDTDGDGYSDFLELNQGSNPTDPNSVPDPNPLVTLSAAGLPAGSLTTWTNTGSYAGNFAAEGGGGLVGTVLGVNAVTFSGGLFTGPAASGAGLTGNPSYSVEAWIYDPTVTAEETIMSWGRRGGPDGSNSSFNYGSNGTYGAMGHWGAPDLGYGVTPPEARWTHVFYTYNSATSTQRAYINGQETSNETLAPGTINIHANDTGGNPLPFRVASQTDDNGNPTGGLRLSGSLAELNVWVRTVEPSEILSRYNAGAITYGTGDQDGDGMPDWYERQYSFLDETNPADANNDDDSDGLTNINEYNPNYPSATSPFRSDPSNPDTDGDGLLDGAEAQTHFTNPSNRDTDQDGLPDNVEIALGTQATGDFTTARDTDGDGTSDAKEVVYGSNPLVFDVTNTNNPIPFVNIDVTGLPEGPVTSITNNNALGWTFNAEVLGTNSTAASVQFVAGTKGLVLNGTNYYKGPNTPLEFSGNASRTVEAWIYNPVVGDEETVFAYGARGTDGRNASFADGRNGSYGALQLFGGGPDVPWGPDAATITANTPAGVWRHVAYVYNNATSLRACYVNGMLAHSETDTNLVLNTFALDASDQLNTLAPPLGRTLPFRLGRQNEQTGVASGAAAATMTIAKVRAYDTALSLAQIAANYNAERVQFPGQAELTNVQVDPVTGFVRFDWTPSPGQTYAVERNTGNPANAGDWSTIATGQTSGSFTNDPGDADQALYRLRNE